MPQPITEIPQPNDNFLVDDSTLERIWGDLHRELRLSEDSDMQFLTWIVPPRQRMIKGIIRFDGMKAAFQVQSPDPNKPGEFVRTFGMTPYDEYKQALAEVGHFVSGGNHPAKNIFAHLMLAHSKMIGAITGLTPMDEERYFKNLAAARWLVEEAQGDRYEEGVTSY